MKNKSNKKKKKRFFILYKENLSIFYSLYENLDEKFSSTNNKKYFLIKRAVLGDEF